MKTSRTFKASLLLVLCLLWHPFNNPSFADEANQQGPILKTGIRFDRLTLEQSIQLALENYPSLHSARARINAAKSGVTLSKTAYLPSLTLSAQMTRGTWNNIAGISLPQGPIFPISGQVVDDPSLKTAWGNALGGLLSWEPFDFGFRRANVALAKTQVEQAVANEKLTEFQLASTVADTFLRVLTAKQAVMIAQANVDRTKVFADTVQALTKNGLKPGVDYSRAMAEQAGARTQLAKAKETEAVALAYLAQLIGMAGQPVNIQGDYLGISAAEARKSDLAMDEHPVLFLQKVNIETVQAREKSLSKAYYPRFSLQLGGYGRGSGVNTNGIIEGGVNGLYPTRGNLVAGISTTFSVLDFPAIRAQREREKFNEEAEKARYDELVQEITGRASQAKASYQAALETASQTPIQLEYAHAGELQIKARYKAGLATVVDVADAQRVLTQSEVEDTLAKVNIWRALLQLAIAQGNLKPYLELIKIREGQ